MKDVNLITILLHCGGADGVSIYLNKEYLEGLEYGYDIIDVLASLFKKIDMKKEVCIRQIDDDYIDYNALEYFNEITDNDPEQNHNKFSDEELEALYNADYELFSKLFNERCGGHISE